MNDWEDDPRPVNIPPPAPPAARGRGALTGEAAPIGAAPDGMGPDEIFPGEIATEACLAEAQAALGRLEPRFAEVSALTGPWPLRRRPDGFAALRDAILGQQVSTASAAAIRARMEAAGLTSPATVQAAGFDALRACGLSRPKIRYMQALAQADVDYHALRRLPDAAVRERLLPIPGIGRWTVEIYLIFALGRADVIACDDLALAEAARMLFGLDTRPRGRAFREMSAAWAPWRSVAARGLWAYYAYRKNREGVAP